MVIPNHFLTPPISEEYIFQSNVTRNQTPDLVNIRKKILVGMYFYVKGDLKSLDLTDEWNTFFSNTKYIDQKSKPKQYYQIQYWLDNQVEEGLYFFIGIEVTSMEDVSPQFVIKTIPEGTYLKFIHKGLSSNVGFTYRYIYNEFLPDSSYKLSKPFNFECFGEGYFSPHMEKSESTILIPIDK